MKTYDGQSTVVALCVVMDGPVILPLVMGSPVTLPVMMGSPVSPFKRLVLLMGSVEAPGGLS